MAGHNKWTQIKRQKAVTDGKKSKIFSKLVRYISVEAKLSNGDKNSPGLRAAVEKAKKVNMPAENIERAIKKASEPSVQMESITYEAYGPGGAGIIIEALTENRNKAAQEIKHILVKNGFALAGIGSVSWAFKKEITSEGLEWVPVSNVQISEENSNTLEIIINELEENDEVQEVYTNAE